MKAYRLEFEYLSPFTGQWERSVRDSYDLDSLIEQRDNQLRMTDVRNSRLLFRDVPEWNEVPEAKP